MTALRRTTGAAGLLLMGFGAYVLLTDAHIRDPRDVVIWLGGAIVLHDGLLAPLVLALGLLTHRLAPRAGSRRILRGGLIVAGSLTAIALPVLLRPGTPANKTVLPLNYLANWLLLIALTTVATAVILALHGRHLRSRRRGGRTKRTIHDRASPPASGRSGHDSP